MSAPSPASPKVRLGRPPMGVVLLALVAWVPLLLTRPGQVGADTKTYLYLDPGRLLSRAAWMWDTHIGMGTVTHQNIGYLWPMGPYYWLAQTIGLPDWVAQRLWLGLIIFAAGTGVRFMLREIGWTAPGLTVASFGYALSPYLLDYGARISVILLPFAGLPWLIGLTSRSMRRGGWRWPAVFALVTLTVGGVNATSLLLVMAGPVLWFLHAVFVAREVTLGRAVGAALRIGLLTLATSLWWMVGLTLQGTYGIPILRYTETYFVVAHAAVSTELMRGLGYWFFYGRDALGAWIQAAESLTQSVPALVLSFTVPGLALVSGLLSRFRHRGYFALLVGVGLVLGIGAHPWDSPSPAGALFKAWTSTESGLAFRSTPRAIPLIALGLSVLLAAGVAALSAWRPSWHLPVAGAAVVLICANQWPLFAGQMVDRNLRRDENIPTYWQKAAAAMQADATGASSDTRVYEMPGADFASYRWGNTVDPVTPGLMDRPYVARELIPYGTPASADLLNALDEPLQEGSFDPRSLVPVAQLMGVGTVVHRGDLQYERFRTPQPVSVWHMLTHTEGLGEPQTFGTRTASEPSPGQALQDEVTYGTPSSWPPAPAVSLFPVEDPRPILRTTSAASPTVMAGDGAGIVAWAATGALDPDRPILYSATFADQQARLRRFIATPASQLVVTDTNRRAARRWGTVRENQGYTERSGETHVRTDPADNRLDLFPGAGDDTHTVTEQVGGATLEASDYGNPVSYSAGDRAVLAMDGNPATAWSVGAFDEPRGAQLEVRLEHPVTTDHLRLLQSQRGGNRWMTVVSLSFDGGDPTPVSLGDSSRTLPGQDLTFGRRTFSRVRITVEDLNVPRLDRYEGQSPVGIAEVTIPGVAPVTEVVRPPTDLLHAAGSSALDHPLTYVFTRRHGDPAETDNRDEEAQLRRVVDGPTARAFTVSGTVRISPAASAPVAGLLGLSGPVVTTSAALPGDVRSRGESALDGDPGTAWQTPLNQVEGQWVQVDSPEPLNIDGLDMKVVRDGRHSVPTALTVQVDDQAPQSVQLPHIGIGDPAELKRGATTTVKVPLAPSSGRRVKVTITGIDPAHSKVRVGDFRSTLPVGIAELGMGVTVSRPAQDAPLPADCRDDVLTVGGRPVPVRLAGTVGQALDGAQVRIESCATLDLGPGRTIAETAPGALTGIDVDRLVLASAAGGAPGPDTLVAGPEPAPNGPDTASAQSGRLTWVSTVRNATEPYWVVLGQSLSPGFRATVTSGRAAGADLGEPTLVNGYANGWLLDPAKVGPDATITITWTPQRLVWIGLGLSALGVLACIVLIAWPRRRSIGAPEAPGECMAPEGISPIAADGPPPSAAISAAVAVAAAVVATVFAGWVVGLAVGVIAAIALAVRWGQVVLRVAAVGLFAAAGGFIVLKQWHYGFLVDFNWMNQFEVTHAWTLTAVALLVLDPVVSGIRRRAPGSTRPDPG